MPTISRRRFFAASAAAAAAPIFPTVHTSDAIAAVSPPSVTPVADLIARWHDLIKRHEAAYDLYCSRYDAAMAIVGKCDVSSVEANRDWWNRYNETPAAKAEIEAEAILAQADDLVTTLINDTPSRTPRDVGRKLRFLLEDPGLWDAESDEPYALLKILSELENWPE